MKFNSTRGKYKSIYNTSSNNSEELNKISHSKIIFKESIFQKKIVKIPVFSGLVEIQEGLGG